MRGSSASQGPASAVLGSYRDRLPRTFPDGLPRNRLDLALDVVAWAVQGPVGPVPSTPPAAAPPLRWTLPPEPAPAP